MRKSRKKLYENVDELEYIDETEIHEERISLYDAALIWFSSGFDEEDRFGYSEEELEATLRR